MPEHGSQRVRKRLIRLGLGQPQAQTLAKLLEEQPGECREQFMALLETESVSRKTSHRIDIAGLLCNLEPGAAAAAIRALPAMNTKAGDGCIQMWLKFLLSFEQAKQASAAWRSSFWLGTVKSPTTTRLCLLLNQALMNKQAPSLRVMGAVLRMAGLKGNPNPLLGMALCVARQDRKAALAWVLNHPAGSSGDLSGKGLAQWLRRGMALGGERRAGFFRVDSTEAAKRADSISGGRTLRLWRGWLEAYAGAHAGRGIRLDFERPQDDLAPYFNTENPERINLPRRMGPGISRPRAVTRALVYTLAMASGLELSSLSGEDVRNVLKDYGLKPPLLHELPPLALFTASFASPRAAGEVLALVLEQRVRALIPDTLPGLKRDLARLDMARRENPPEAGLLPPDLRMACAAFQMICGISMPAGVPPEEMVTARRIANEAERAGNCQTPLSILELCAGICRLLPPECAAPGISYPAESAMGTLTYQGTGDPAGSGQGYGPHFEQAGQEIQDRALPQPFDPLEALTGASPGRGREPGGFAYPEWDDEQGRLIKNRAWVVERTPREDDPADLRKALAGQRGLAERVRKAFQDLAQPGPKPISGRLSGVRLDLDALIRERIDWRAGFAPQGRIYQQPGPRRGEFCCGILWDVSGSTRRSTGASGPGTEIINTSREALAIFCRALGQSGDRFAVWAFSGVGPDRVDFYRLKGFASSWGERNLRFLAAVKPLAQNRDGAAIRHAVHLMSKQKARHKILIILGDGRPDDYAYPPEAAGRDISLALAEARKGGIKSLSMLLPSSGRMPHQCYLDSPHVTLPSINGLTRILPQVYHRLTA